MKKITIFILSAAMGIITGMGIVGCSMEKLIRKNKDMSDKHLALFLMMNQWVKVKQEKKGIVEYFEKNRYKKIAIYGMSYVGETLLEELYGTDVEVAYAIDKNAESIYSDINIVTTEVDFEEVDAVVVTAITFYDEIEEELKEKVKCPILSLEDILYEI